MKYIYFFVITGQTGVEFLQKVCMEVRASLEGLSLVEVVWHVLEFMRKKVASFNLVHAEVSHYLSLLTFFTSNEVLADVC